MNITIIPAAGRGKRMASPTSKQFLLLAGKPVLAHTLAAFEDAELVDGVIVVGKAKDLEFCKTKIVKKYGFKKVTGYVIGGRRRQDSVANALKALPPDTQTVIVHDAARPLVTPDLIDRAIREAKKWPALTVGMPVKNTIKRITAGELVEYTLDRPRLWAIQTPQVFKADVLLHAHRVAKTDKLWGTDDTMLVEKIGHPVRVIEGSEENIKITTPIDMLIAEAIISRRKKGK